MSLIIAVKDGDRYVVGADKQCSTGYSKDHSATKIWLVEGIPGVVMGGVGSVRASQIIQYSKIINLNHAVAGFTTEYITRSLIPEIISALESNGVNCSTSSDDNTKLIPNSFLFAADDRAWIIWNDLSVIEIGDYFAIGSGSDVAKGALFATKKNKNPFERIVTGIEAAAETTLYVDDGVDLLATNMRESDMKLIDKAFGYEKPVEQNKPKAKSSNKKSGGKTKNEN